MGFNIFSWFNSILNANKNYNAIQSDYAQCLLEKQDLLKQISDLKSYHVQQPKQDPKQVVSAPDWLDQKQGIYTPIVSIAEADVPIRDACEIYCWNDYLKTQWEKQFRGSSDEDTKLLVWKWICNSLSYSYDKTEDWQYATTTLFRLQGDCEDGTILFVTICNALGIYDAFNATGYYTNGTQQFGHSFPIANFNGELCVFETTLHPYDSSRPRPLKGSPYDCSWGLSNALWKGKMISTSAPIESSPFERLTEEENQKKLEAIKKFWGENK